MSLKAAAESVRAAGRGKDTELVHFTKNEVAGLSALAKAAGGKLTRNPKTGMVEAGFLESMLPTILGVAANFVVPGSGVIVGGLTGAMQNKDNPLMGAALGAAGGYGGGQLAAGLQGVGAGAAQAVAQEGVNAAVQQGVQEAGVGALTDQGVQNLAAASNQAAANATTDFMAKPLYEQAGAGLSATVNDPSAFLQGMGGGKAAMQSAAMAAAPAIMAPTEYGGSEYGGDGEASEYNYDAGFTGGTMTGPDASSERDWFDPTFTRMAAGGSVGLAEGGFVIPADVVSMIGNGSSDAGLEALAKHLGATPIDGPGDGMSDSIPADIDGNTPAAVARQEAYLTPAQVQAVGGEDKLYELLARVRQQAHGTQRQQRPVQPEQVLQ